MGTLNLGALLFAMLLVVWVGYALPRTAARRELMGQAREVEKSRDSETARVLSSATRPRPTAREVSSMPEDRLLLRPADPTRRPRFGDDPGTRMGRLPAPSVPGDHGGPDTPDGRSRCTVHQDGSAAGRSAGTARPTAVRNTPLLRGVLAALLVATIVVGLLGGFSVLPAWAVIFPAAALIAYLVGLRRTELERRRTAGPSEDHGRRHEDSGTAPAQARATVTAAPAADETSTARTESVDPAQSVSEEAPSVGSATAAPDPQDSALGQQIEDAAQDVIAPGSWIPRPVPRPTYALHGEVEDLASRHAEHRRSVAARPVPLEVEEDEADEALAEQEAVTVPRADLGLDEILRRRRA